MTQSDYRHPLYDIVHFMFFEYLDINHRALDKMETELAMFKDFLERHRATPRDHKVFQRLVNRVDLLENYRQRLLHLIEDTHPAIATLQRLMATPDRLDEWLQRSAPREHPLFFMELEQFKHILVYNIRTYLSVIITSLHLMKRYLEKLEEDNVYPYIDDACQHLNKVAGCYIIIRENFEQLLVALDTLTIRIVQPFQNKL